MAALHILELNGCKFNSTKLVVTSVDVLGITTAYNS